MKNERLTAVSVEVENAILRLSLEASASTLKMQKEAIKNDSPYSSKINEAIKSYQEFLLYYNLHLREAYITRPALIKDLDLDLWVSCENKTNLQLLHEGNSPYAYDAEDGKIELHHIGQGFDAPFAELTTKEHMLYGNNRLLHDSLQDSWRRDEEKLNSFQLERIKYWEKRATGKYNSVVIQEFKQLEPRAFSTKQRLSYSIKKAIETLFAEISVEDLNYIASLSNSYALVKQIGVNSLNDFINHEKEKSKITCSFCGESNYVANGTYSTAEETIQRFLCKKCGKSFTQVNSTIISGSNLTFVEWIKFIDCMYEGFSVEKTAI